jgi:hypothetical protein
VGGAAEVGLDVDSFGRMVRVEFMNGSIPASCSDGSQRPLPLAGPEGFVLAAPIRWTGGFTISAAAGSSIRIAGTFAGGSVAAFLNLSVLLPDGTQCTGPAQPLVGSLLYPIASAGENENYPRSPVIIHDPL